MATDVQSVVDCGCGIDGRFHGKPRHEHRQRGAAVYGGEPGHKQRRENMGVEFLLGIQCDRAPDQRMVRHSVWTEAIFHDMPRDLHLELSVVWICAKPWPAAHI